MVMLSFFLVLTQVFMKFGIMRTGALGFSFECVKACITNIYFWLAGLSMFIACIIWLVVLRNHDLSLLYPLISFTYVFALIAGAVVFKETITLMRMLGVFVIIAGIVIVIKS